MCLHLEVGARMLINAIQLTDPGQYQIGFGVIWLCFLELAIYMCPAAGQ